MAKKKSKKKAPPKKEKPEPRSVEINTEVEVEDQIALNELPTLFPNSYEIVVAAARRARQLNLGLKPLVKTRMHRPVDVALAEIAAGKVEYSTGDQEPEREAKTPKKKPRSKKS
jgi:DNA-directed RNA polymerase omega subunit